MVNVIINGKYFNAEIEKGWKITASDIGTEIFKGRNCSSFRIIEQEYGMKKLQFKAVFFGKDQRDLVAEKSKLDMELLGKATVQIEDMLFTGYVTSIGTISFKGYEMAECDYKLDVFQHAPRVLIEGASVICESTVPLTDCIIHGVATATAGYFGDVVFGSVNVNDEIEINGEDVILKVNGNPAANKFSFRKFPQLVPGVNDFEASGLSNITISYLPTYL